MHMIHQQAKAAGWIPGARQGNDIVEWRKLGSIDGRSFTVRCRSEQDALFHISALERYASLYVEVQDAEADFKEALKTCDPEECQAAAVRFLSRPLTTL